MDDIQQTHNRADEENNNRNCVDSSCVALVAWTLLNGYNIWDTCHESHLTIKYFFQLTHVTSFLIGAVFLISLIYQCRKHKPVKNTHFSNLVSFTFGLSMITDLMFWLFVFNPNHSLSGFQWADIILMHGVITLVLLSWMLAKCQVPFQHGYAPFKAQNCCQWIGSVAKVFVPILIITGAYMGWTYWGQSILHQPIYTNVIDWSNTHVTMATFTKAAIGFVVLTSLYWFTAWSVSLMKCGRRDRIQLNSELQQRLLDSPQNAEIDDNATVLQSPKR
jgi:hypothetical protein